VSLSPFAVCMCCVSSLQAEGSCYELVEARVGGSLTRHDLGIEQAGPETTTTMKHFVLAGEFPARRSYARCCYCRNVDKQR